jgi:hypothetical protein
MWTISNMKLVIWNSGEVHRTALGSEKYGHNTQGLGRNGHYSFSYEEKWRQNHKDMTPFKTPQLTSYPKSGMKPVERT